MGTAYLYHQLEEISDLLTLACRFLLSPLVAGSYEMIVLLDGVPVGGQFYNITTKNAEFWPNGTSLTTETTPAAAGQVYQMSFQATDRFGNLYRDGDLSFAVVATASPSLGQVTGDFYDSSLSHLPQKNSTERIHKVPYQRVPFSLFETQMKVHDSWGNHGKPHPTI